FDRLPRQELLDLWRPVSDFSIRISTYSELFLEVVQPLLLPHFSSSYETTLHDRSDTIDPLLQPILQSSGLVRKEQLGVLLHQSRMPRPRCLEVLLQLIFV